MILMCKDVEVMEIDLRHGFCKIYREDLLPYWLRGQIENLSYDDAEMNKESYLSSLAALSKYNDIFRDYIANRVLPLSRSNAKIIYNLYDFAQLQDSWSKYRIAESCRAVSVTDNYWMRSRENSDVCWKDVDVRTNHLNDLVMLAALHGESFTLEGSPHTPELTNQGSFAKAWKREGGQLWLYKKGLNGGDREAKIEVMVSNLLDKCNVEHVHYEEAKSQGRIEGPVYCCKCPCMTDDEHSIVTAYEYARYCKNNGLDFWKEILRIDATNVLKMWIVDYLIANGDRHSMNWGVFADGATMKILKCHPLFDHNLAFAPNRMKDPDADYKAMKKRSQRKVAHEAIKKIDFHFTEHIGRKDFMTVEQYNCFMGRAKELGIKNPPKARTKRMNIFGRK